MRNLWLVLVGILIGLITAGAMVLLTGQSRGTPITILPTPTAQPLVVYISGDVKNPGVYRMLPGARIVDLVKAAGGFISGALYDNLNLAEALTDGQRVRVGSEDGESPTPMLMIGEDGLVNSLLSPEFEPLNLNTASAKELAALPAIGPTLASKIVEYRNINGDFLSVEDLGMVPGVTTSILNEVMEYLTVE